MFPLILLQAKAGGLTLMLFWTTIQLNVSINSPSGEGGGRLSKVRMVFTIQVSINSPSGEGGGGRRFTCIMDRCPKIVSINSPSGEGGGSL